MRRAVRGALSQGDKNAPQPLCLPHVCVEAGRLRSVIIENDPLRSTLPASTLGRGPTAPGYRILRLGPGGRCETPGKSRNKSLARPTAAISLLRFIERRACNSV